MEDIDSDVTLDSDLDTDEELQVAFSAGKLQELKSGLIKPLVPKKNFTNDVSALREKLEEIEKKKLEWLERMDVVSTIKTNEARQKIIEVEGDTLDPNDDFKREMHFLEQAQSAVVIGLEKLSELDIPTLRPEDYFAEMMKNDDHMRKVRENLLSKQKRIEAIEKAKKLRDLRKYGKKVQQEVLEQRRKEKKSSMDAMKKYSKGREDKPAVLRKHDDFAIDVEKGRVGGNKGPPGLSHKSKHRQAKDVKYGQGGRKKGLRRNTAESSSDMRSFRSYKGPKHSAKMSKSKRPGKINRHRIKHQRNK